jgi:GTP-binding protein
VTEPLPVVAVVGRPNVGKSTLINRFLGRREAIVEEKPGVTRDRKSFPVEWAGKRFFAVDTGGWEPHPGTAITQAVSRQAEAAIERADLVLFVVDVHTGVTEEDAGVVEILRRSTKPVIVVANKADSAGLEAAAGELWALGVGDVVAVSSLHGRNSGDLLDAIVARLPNAPDVEDDSDLTGPPRIALAGRPNVGKSTLFNRMVGEERSIVHSEGGTTRDTIDTIVEMPDGRTYVFVDTAGMRRRSNVDTPTEYYSVVRTLQAIDRSDATLLLLDASEGITHQDQALAERVMAAGSAPIIVLNKWDLTDDEKREEISEQIEDKLWFCSWAPLVRISALTGRGTQRILPSLDAALEARSGRIGTPALNRLIQRAQEEQPPKPEKGRRVPKIKYAVQGGTEPPTFTFFASAEIGRTYLRYLERRIREEFGLGPTPVKVRVRVGK